METQEYDTRSEAEGSEKMVASDNEEDENKDESG